MLQVILTTCRNDPKEKKSTPNLHMYAFLCVCVHTTQDGVKKRYLKALRSTSSITCLLGFVVILFLFLTKIPKATTTTKSIISQVPLYVIDNIVQITQIRRAWLVNSSTTTDFYKTKTAKKYVDIKRNVIHKTWTDIDEQLSHMVVRYTWIHCLFKSNVMINEWMNERTKDAAAGMHEWIMGLGFFSINCIIIRTVLSSQTTNALQCVVRHASTFTSWCHIMHNSYVCMCVCMFHRCLIHVLILGVIVVVVFDGNHCKLICTWKT